MYCSTSPAGTYDVKTGKPVAYDAETIARYRDAVLEHGRLAPYIWEQVQHSVATGDPIMRPLFFDFPEDAPGYTVRDEWMLGPAVLAAPMLTPGDRRDVFLPSGVWYDVNRGRTVRGPRLLRDYAAPLSVTPVFVDLKAPGAGMALGALRHG
jgi:alpha-glucosidase (family GH31 glycosyl hydrolase)